MIQPRVGLSSLMRWNPPSHFFFVDEAIHAETDGALAQMTGMGIKYSFRE